MQYKSIVGFKITLVTLLLVTSAACAPSSAPSPTSIVVPRVGSFEKIAFTSNRSGTDHVYVMNADGSGVTQLTSGPAKEYSPAWSPDGRKIAFLSRQDNQTALYVVNADGSDRVKLTEDLDINGPVWSFNGKKLAFAAYFNHSLHTDIFVIDADGSKLTNVSNSTFDALAPTWSPDSSWLAFHSGQPAIYTVNADGSRLITLTHDTAYDFSPTWSPDGTEIAFTSEREVKEFSPEQGAPSWEIHLIHPDGSGLMNLTHDAGFDLSPVWSPDGKRIAFLSNRANPTARGKFEIYAMNADGSNLIRLTDNWLQPTTVVAPSWSPDGKQLVAVGVEACDKCNAEIFVINVDGSGLMNITNNPADDTDAVWQP